VPRGKLPHFGPSISSRDWNFVTAEAVATEATAAFQQEIRGLTDKEEFMISRKVLRTLVAGMALGVAAVPLASTAWAASDTSGLAPLTLEGVGPGSLGAGNCPSENVSCAVNDACECLTATYTLVGNQGFSKGDLGVVLSVDTTHTELPISDLEESCYPAAGTGKLSNSNGKIIVNMTVSGLECPTLLGPNVFNGTYVVTGGSGGKFSSSSGGTGSISGSQETTGGAIGQVAVIGTIQPAPPAGSSISSDSDQAPQDSDQAPQ
jgi:hypothetical protein